MNEVEAFRLCANCKAEVKKLAVFEADKLELYKWFLKPEVLCQVCNQLAMYDCY